MGRLRYWLAAGTFVVGAVAQGDGALRACSTPVNRYALYRWPPSPYFVFQVRDGEEAAPDAEIRKAFLAAVDSESAPANVEFTSVDVADPESVKALPAEVRERIEQLEKPADQTTEKPDGARRSRYLVFNPHGGFVHAGRLEPDDVGAMLSSPARRRLAESLAEGHDGVLLFVPGTDEKESDRARKEARQAIEMVRKDEDKEKDKEDGSEEGGDAVGEDGKNQPSAEGGLFESDHFDSWDVGFLEIGPDDPKERWLLRFLQSTEELEPGEKEKPMVFAAYGRGRVMEPYIGGGIESRNLLSVINFVNGPCSCQVKDENPGVDLLASWDWEATALKIAKSVGEETGNEHLLGGDGFLWDVSEVTLPDADEGSEGSSQKDDGTGGETTVVDTVDTEVIEAPGEPTTSSSAAETPSATTPSTAGETIRNRNVIIGVGLGVAALLLVAITVVRLRRRDG